MKSKALTLSASHTSSCSDRVRLETMYVINEQYNSWGIHLNWQVSNHYKKLLTLTEVFCIVVFDTFFEANIISFFKLRIPPVLLYCCNKLGKLSGREISLLCWCCFCYIFTLSVAYMNMHICILLEFCLIPELLISILCVWLLFLFYKHASGNWRQVFCWWIRKVQGSWSLHILWKRQVNFFTLGICLS